MKFILAVLFLSVLFVQAFSQNLQPVKIRAGGVEFQYIEKGQGEPLILLHGGLGDYRSWEPQMEALSKTYRVISYSRRFHYPNNNPLTNEYRAVLTEAEDLNAFLHELKLEKAHLVGVSYGGFTALVFALKHPKMIRSMVLVEPPVHRLVRDLPDGEAVYQNFMSAFRSVAGAFKLGDEKEAMRIFNGILGRDFDKLPPPVAESIMQNSLAVKALAFSNDPFPKISQKQLRTLKIPVLVITGENTVKIHKLVDRELARLIPDAKEFLIPNAGHGSPRENPQVFNETVLKFLAAVENRPGKNAKH